MKDICSYTKIEDGIPKQYSNVILVKLNSNGEYKAYRGLYHNGFYWCGMEMSNVVMWKYAG